jgi:hypothetical protein
MPRLRSPSLVHPTPIKILLTTTLRPLVVQRSGALAQGVRLLDQSLHAAPTPQQMTAFERNRRAQKHPYDAVRLDTGQ